MIMIVKIYVLLMGNCSFGLSPVLMIGLYY